MSPAVFPLGPKHPNHRKVHMSREFNAKKFDSLYEQYICRDEFQFGGSDYYRRYRSRYKECIERFAKLAPSSRLDVLDVGGGQLALMCAKLWGDKGVASDLPGPHMDYIASLGIETITWDLCKAEFPLDTKFDCIFFSEVIEHLPIPGYIVLQKLAKILKPGGFLICTTPNLYRLKNVVFMVLGKPIFDNFQYSDQALAHVVEYSRDHLEWQFKKAGFSNCTVEYSQMGHMPTNPLYRPLALLGYPLHLLPRWRDNLVATGFAPEIKEAH